MTSQRGASLVEALVSLGCIGLLAVGVASAVDVVGAASRRAEHAEWARATAEDLMAQVHALGHHELPDLVGASGDATVASLALTEARHPGLDLDSEAWAVLPGLTARVRIEGLAGGGAPAAMRDALGLRIEVAVSWMERVGRDRRPRRVRLVTVRS